MSCIALFVLILVAIKMPLRYSLKLYMLQRLFIVEHWKWLHWAHMKLFWGNVDLACFNVTYLVLESYNVTYTVSSPWEDWVKWWKCLFRMVVYGTRREPGIFHTQIQNFKDTAKYLCLWDLTWDLLNTTESSKGRTRQTAGNIQRDVHTLSVACFGGSERPKYYGADLFSVRYPSFSQSTQASADRITWHDAVSSLHIHTVRFVVFHSNIELVLCTCRSNAKKSSSPEGRLWRSVHSCFEAQHKCWCWWTWSVVVFLASWSALRGGQVRMLQQPYFVIITSLCWLNFF
jgi:hypothetical protein